MKIVIAAGGTGGHLFPGIAVANALKKADPAGACLFIGTDRGIEKGILPKEGFRHEALRVGKLKGVGILRKIKTLLGLPRAIREAGKILQREGADFVLGVGGYSSGPVILSAFLKKIPRAIIEPNAIPGFTNKILGKFVDRVFVAFPEAGKFFPKEKVSVTGTPVREGLYRISNSEDRISGGGKKFTLLILGGSQGAASLNRTVMSLLPCLKSAGPAFRIVHQTGEKDFESVKRIYEISGVDHVVQPFFTDVASLYKEADLVVCRAGASTIAELVATRTPAIFVPYPFAADDHQRFNALSIVSAGGGEMILDRNLGEGRESPLLERILFYSKNRDALDVLKRKLAELDKIPASAAVAQQCLELAHVSNT